MHKVSSCAVLAAAFAIAGCAVTPEQRAAGATPLSFSPSKPQPVYVADRPPCRVWDEDIFGRRYCRVPYVYDRATRN